MSRREKYLMIVCLSMIEAILVLFLLTPSSVPHSRELMQAVAQMVEHPSTENQQKVDAIRRRVNREALPYELAIRGPLALLAAGNLWAIVRLVKKRAV
ncbi:MAG: hypothetical protein NTV22_00770 [bacterium]|nr:hypothetical protein [bacterium]